jgi:hypothetical protein
MYSRKSNDRRIEPFPLAEDDFSIACLKLCVIWGDITELLKKWVPEANLNHFEKMLIREVYYFAQQKDIDILADYNSLNYECCLWAIERIMEDEENYDKYVGVVKEENKWKAEQRVRGKLVPLGLFDTEKEAARVYNNAIVASYKKVGILNSISDDES